MNFLPLSKNHLKQIQKLHHKKYRQEEKLFIAEGSNAFEAAASAPYHIIKEAFFSGEYLNSYRIPDFLTCPMYVCSPREMSILSTEKTPQGILIVCKQHDFTFSSLSNHPSEIILYFDLLSDPGNLGTIIRTASWFGIRQIMLSNNCVDPFNTKVIRASAGSIFKTELYMNVSQHFLLTFANQYGYNVIATIPSGGTPLSTWGKTGKTIIMFGNEASGLDTTLIKRADQRVSIPGNGTVDSLNLAVAAAITLYEIAGRKIPA